MTVYLQILYQLAAALPGPTCSSSVSSPFLQSEKSRCMELIKYLEHQVCIRVEENLILGFAQDYFIKPVLHR